MHEVLQQADNDEATARRGAATSVAAVSNKLVVDLIQPCEGGAKSDADLKGTAIPVDPPVLLPCFSSRAVVGSSVFPYRRLRFVSWLLKSYFFSLVITTAVVAANLLRFPRAPSGVISTHGVTQGESLPK